MHRNMLHTLITAVVLLCHTEGGHAKNVTVWAPPAGTAANGTWDVAVREKDGAWESLFVYAVKVGHQEKKEPLATTVGLIYEGPVDSSMVKFDCTGQVEVRATFRKGALSHHDIAPVSYAITVRKEGNTLYFPIVQDSAAPKKIVLRANGDWEEHCLHIITNPPERSAPSENGPGVMPIEPGQDIPRTLPKNKSVYYFKPGVHVLPRGVWVELDLGTVKRIDRCDLISGPPRKFLVPGGQNYRIEYRTAVHAPWQIACEHTNNADIDPRIQFPAVDARHVRLILLGNTTTNRTKGFNYLHANHITAFCVYPEGSDVDCAAGKAVNGAIAGFHKVTSPGNTSYYGAVWSGETFFIPGSGVTMYLAPGAVVKGAVAADQLANITIRGRGILDASELVHHPSNLYREGRTGAIRCESMNGITIEGLTVLDSPKWAVVLNRSKNASVRNVDFFGSIVNADGIHMSAVDGGIVDGCFLRSTDDLFCMYHYGPGKNVVMKNSVLWTDGGRAVLLGMADTKGDIESVSFENIDILNIQNVWDMDVHGGALHIVASGGNTIRNIRFHDIRIEPFRFPSIASVLQVKTLPAPHGGGGPGKAQAISFDNLSYGGSGEYRSYLAGVSDEFFVSNIIFRNCTWGQTPLTNGHVQLEIRSFVSDVQFR